STRIGSTLDVTRTAQELVEVAVRGFADFAVVDLLEIVARGEEPAFGPVEGSVPLRRMAAASILDGTPEAMTKPGETTSYAQQSRPAECLATGQAVFCADAGEAMARWAANEPERAWRFDLLVGRLGVHSVVVVPLQARGTMLGVAAFVRHQRPEPF